VWKVPADGEQAVQLTKQGGYTAVESPDGKELYYERFAQSGIWMVPTTGGEETLLSDLISPNWSTWAVRPEGIYFVGDGKDSGLVLRVYDFTTRKVSQVARLGKGLVAGGGLSISPDGRWVLYSRIDHSSSNIMLVENFR
jgi:Tol biopolymer transport system component